ncbi:SusC/RagA family TonB-linked outer membrane protein [Sphingobacteruim zhuxiongii]|nr:SusC/RagA family TonB-linked outer membrane protein [Sphingobacterium sp. DK4209]
MKKMGRYSLRLRNVWLIMRLTTLLLLIGMLQLSATSLAQKVNLQQKNAPLKQVLNELNRQTGYNFLYTESMLNRSKNVNVNIRNTPLKDALNEIFALQPLTYVLDKNTIVLALKPSAVAVVNTNAISSNQQTTKQIVKGQVLVPAGESALGVTLVVAARKIGLSTKADGTFELELQHGDILEFSRIGLSTLRLLYEDGNFKQLANKQNRVGQDAIEESSMISGRNNYLMVKLLPSPSSLDEIQVMAYGTTSKRISTGNITKISGEELNQSAVNDPLLALQGRVPGMIVTPDNGKPGAMSKVQIRGRTQVDTQFGANEEPLFIVDGVPMAAQNNNSNITMGNLARISAFSMMDMGNIESIEVLKDADATAIYGSRGASGVVLITTKKAKAGNTSYDINYSVGGSYLTLPKMLSTEEYVAYRKEAFKNDRIPMTNANAYDILLWDTTRNDNNMEELLGNMGKYTRLQAAVSGGSAGMSYRFSGHYNSETSSIYKSPTSTNVGTSVNIVSSSKDKKFTINMNTSFTHTLNRQSGVEMGNVIYLPPNAKLINEDGSLFWNENDFYVSGMSNPYAQLKNINESRIQNYIINAHLNYSILPNLTVRANLGYNQSKSKAVQTVSIASQNPKGSNLTGTTYWGNNDLQSINIEPQIEYTNPSLFGGKLNVLLGGTYNENRMGNDYIGALGYKDDEYLGTYIGLNSSNFTSPNMGTTEYKYAAAFARLIYNYKNKYNLSISGRRDGSSRFGPNYQYSNFGSIGASWAISEEAFFPKETFVSFAKLRGSYGITGNDKIGDYKFLDLYESNFFNSPYDSEVAMTPASFFKPDLHWELTSKLEFAAEGTLWEDRVNYSMAWYKQRTSDPLVQYPLPLMTGFGAVSANIKDVLVDNSGFEIMLGGTVIRTKSFQWSTDFNLTIPKNVLSRFDGLENTTYNLYKVGRSLNSLYRLKYLGVDPETGLNKHLDANNDGRLDLVVGGADMHYIGDSDQKYFGGWQNNFRYKQFNLSLFINFHRQIEINYENGAPIRDYGIRNMYAHMLDQRWKNPGDIATVPRVTQTNVPTTGVLGDFFTAAMNSDYLREELTMLRLGTVMFSYNLPEKLVHRLKLSRSSLFLQGQNIYSFYLDSKFNPNHYVGLHLPMPRRFTVGIQLNF